MDCTNCGSDFLSWTLDTIKRGSIGDGLLSMHDVTPVLVLGCDYCSETLEIVTDISDVRIRWAH